MAGIEYKVVKSFNNPCLNRLELTMNINHSKKSTPSKDDIASEISPVYNINKENIYVFGVKTVFGSNETVANVHLYKNKKMLEEIERSFVIARISGERIMREPRKQRKEKRLKAYKMFGTLARNRKKAEKRVKDE